MRQRQDTIGSLGRAPARASKAPPIAPPPPLPVPDGGRARRWIRSALVDNIGLKFLSLVLAVTVFLLVNTDRDREITARIGVAYSLPDDKVLVSRRVEEVRVTIKGPWRRLRRFNERDVDRVNIDPARAHAGEVAITPDMIKVPAGLVVEDITPRSVQVQLEPRKQ